MMVKHSFLFLFSSLKAISCSSSSSPLPQHEREVESSVFWLDLSDQSYLEDEAEAEAPGAPPAGVAFAPVAMGFAKKSAIAFGSIACGPVVMAKVLFSKAT